MKLLPRSHFLYFMKTYIYVYTCVFLYNMHILDKTALQVFRNVHIMILETFTHMRMDAEQNETTPTIPFYVSYEDSDVHSTHMSRET